MFCNPEIRPRVVALPLIEVVLLDNQAGTRTAGVKDPKVRRKVLFPVSTIHIPIKLEVSQEVSQTQSYA